MVWVGEIKIKDLLSPEDVTDAVAVGVAECTRGRISICPLFPIPVRHELMDRFTEVTDQDSFNQAMDRLYDAADQYRVWVA